MRGKRRDANHVTVGDHLRSMGWSVLDLADCGDGVPDYAVSYRWPVGAFCALVEVKDGSKPPSARQLTPKEQKVKDGWQGDYIIALSPEDAETKLNAAMVRAGCCRMEDLA
jgi:hypothetical protein